MVARGSNATMVLNGLTNLAMISGDYERLAYVGLDSNSQGCRDMGVLPNALPGHANLDDDDARRRLQDMWGSTLPTEPGKTYHEMLDAAGSDMKALYIMGANPASERPSWKDNLQRAQPVGRTRTILD